MKKTGIDVRLKSKHKAVHKKGDKEVELELEDGTKLSAETVLLSIGRSPNVSGLGLEKTGVKLDGKAVWVDEYQNSSVEGVYAIGDAINNIQLTPVAKDRQRAPRTT